MSKYLELVEGSFTQEHLDKQNNQKPYVAYSITDGKVIYSIIPKEEDTMYTIYRVISKDISNCTYNMVDLGLSVKWADRNVGASSPEDFGSYFQWGDTNAYTFDGAGEVTAAEMVSLLQSFVGDEMEVTKDNVGEILEMMGIVGTDLTPMGLGGSLDKFFNWESYFDTTDSGSTFNKYNNEDGLTVLELNDDASYIHTDSQYRIPTIDEIYELINNTTQTFIDVDGNVYIKDIDDINIESRKLKGVRFTSSNGNSIFIPAAGYCYMSLLLVVGTDVMLWSSSLGDGDDYSIVRSCDIHCNGHIGIDGSYTDRCAGQPIRGVQA